ncbi:TPA: DNA-binding protein [Vibrio parahaemolyticus]|uniref:DNA-binding protein n=2 Tax=Vibrio alginolyticus TaxID=663 RepID=UPI001EEEC628|nr:DNA-binding protein [Vibrio alginolyticus]ULF72033.1 DNA-binding protein [Vibrio alginolyticus]HCE2641714.1 DNA-binding protein [Vibrio parahaemolyticus]HCH4213719.1 DNA-binding protein [Vibrio parahaemolyticus]
MTQPGIPSEIRDRIFQVANELYDEANREKMPTVDQVRRAAKADMNTTSSVMREWRKQQTSQVAPVIVTVPERVQDEFQGAIASAWNIAQEVANEALHAAQKGWDDERAEAEQLRSEMAQAFEVQSVELEAKTNALSQELESHNQTKSELDQARKQLQELTDQLHDRETKLASAESKIIGQETRITELKSELMEANNQNNKLQNKLGQTTEDLATSQAENKASANRAEEYQAEIKALRSQSETDRKHHEKQLEERQVRIDTSSQELVEVRSKLDAEREKLSTAIEQRAMLEGELNALKDKEKTKGKAEK